MNPLDKSWTFLKAPVDESKERLAEQAAARREALRRKAEEEYRTRDQTGLERWLYLQRFAEDAPLGVKQIEARNNAARANLAAANASQETTYPQPPISEPSQGPIVHDSGNYDPHKPDTMHPGRSV